MSSHRQIFRTSAIMGSASVINILISIIKIKVVALLLGPAGIGLIGLYQSIVGIASTLASCGMATSGVRQLAASVGEQETLDIVRRALWLGSLILGLIGMILLWQLRESVSQWVFGDIIHTEKVGWLGLGVLFTLIAGSQTALLQGLRRIGDLARVNIISASIAAMVGLLAIYLLREDGVLWFVLSAPATSILVAWHYASRLPCPQTAYEWQAIHQQWLTMLKLGLPLMATGLLALVTQLIVRSIVVRKLGLEASGYFQAAWAISMTYIGFVLGAMASDYYPRLSGIINNQKSAGRLVNEQAEMALLLSAPVLLAMITLAPWIINLLYAKSFAPAIDILHWQVLGDILKVASWPMSYILLALGRGGIFIGIELTWNVMYLGVIALGISEDGLIVTGVGFWLSYLVYYCVVGIVAIRLINFKLDWRNMLFTLILSLAGGMIILIANLSSWAGYVTGIAMTLMILTYSLWRLNELMDIRSFIKKLVSNNSN